MTEPHKVTIEPYDKVLAETIEDEGFMAIDQNGRDTQISITEGQAKQAIRAGRSIGKARSASLLLAALGHIPEGFAPEPTTHDKISASVHDHQGALDRARSKLSRKLQRNRRNNK